MTNPQLDMSKHIVHLASSHFPFDTRIYHRECLTLIKADYKVTLIVPAIPVDLPQGVYEGVRVIPVPSPSTKLARVSSFSRLLYSRAIDQDADLYHIHDWELLPWAVLLQWRRRKPVIFDRHEYYVERFRDSSSVPSFARPVVSKAYELIEQGLVSQLDGVVTVSDEMAQKFRGRSQNVVSVYNYPRRSLVQQPVHSLDSKSVIYIGRMSRVKGYRVVLESMTLVRQEEPDARAYIVGELEPPEVRATYIADEDKLLQLGRIELVDRVPHDQLSGFLSRSALGWIPWLPTANTVRGIPHKLFEYLAAGRPVVASRMGVIEEYVERERCGLLVEPGNSRMHADAILYLLNHPEEAQAMGERGRQAILQKYNWESQERELLAFYQRVLSDK